MVDIRPISFYLELKVQHDWDNYTIKLFQPAYLNKGLCKFHFDKIHVVAIFIKENTILQAKIKSKPSITKREKYQNMIGSIIFLMIEIRPDIVFATLIARCFAKNPSYQYIKAIKSILQYLNRSRD